MKFSILIPDGTTNYITNPQIRNDTTGWNAAGATLTRTLNYARFGIASLQVVTTGAALHEGAFFRVSALSGISDKLTVSIYARGAGMVRIRLDDNAPGGAEYSSETVQLTTERWQRLSVTGRCNGGNDLRLYVETNESAAVARTFYLDGAQMERKSFATTYCDGEQPGCRWNGLYHGSSSLRASATRQGGRWLILNGDEREYDDLYMTVVGGLGAMKVANSMQNYALKAGAWFSNYRPEVRIVTLTFHAKNTQSVSGLNESLEHLHELRRTLIDAVKPDRTIDSEEIWFCYEDGDIPIYFKARYDGGLEGEWDVRNSFVQSFPMRLVGVDPYMYEDSQESSLLDFQESVNANYIMGRINGQWKNMNYGFNNYARAFAKGKNGEIYAMSGLFTVVNNNAAAYGDPLKASRGPVYWDGDYWREISGQINSSSNKAAIAVGPNGYVYAGGDFTSIGGVAANRIAYWNGSSWNAMGTGMNNAVYSIVVAPNGDVYAGGNFTQAGGVNCYYVARWDGLQWRRVGPNGGVSAYVNTVEINQDGTVLYLGGNFTSEYGGGKNLYYVASYTISEGQFYAMGSGLDSTVVMVKRSSQGDLYAVGLFRDLYGSLTNTIEGVARYNGQEWVSISNIAGAGDCISFTKDGNLVISGAFATAAGRNIPMLAEYNGSNWMPMDIDLNIAVSFMYSYVNPDTDDLFISGSFSGNQAVSGMTTITNPGSADVPPKIFIKGSGRLMWIENQSTQKRLRFDMTLLANEEVIIDCAAATITSLTRGSLTYTLIPGSDLGGFVLLPGENTMACLMTDDVSAQMSIQFVPRHWSADSTATLED